MRALCVVPQCGKGAKAKGLCGMHYQQKRRTGHYTTHETCFQWLQSNGKAETDECIAWPFSVSVHGYGQVTVDGKNKNAHRVSCEIFNGPPPSPQHEVAHSCGNRGCVNRRHLRWATGVENAADRILHGTHREGEDAGPAKLTNAQAALIRKDTRPQRVIATAYGVTQRSINLIKQSKTYRKAGM